jgi:hypothetical protein
MRLAQASIIVLITHVPACIVYLHACTVHNFIAQNVFNVGTQTELCLIRMLLSSIMSEWEVGSGGSVCALIVL